MRNCSRKRRFRYRDYETVNPLIIYSLKMRQKLRRKRTDTIHRLPYPFCYGNGGYLFSKGPKAGGPKTHHRHRQLRVYPPLPTPCAPPGFQKIRYYGFLNNRTKSRNLKLIFIIQGHQGFKARFTGMSMAQLVLAVWKKDITRCRLCQDAACSDFFFIQVLNSREEKMFHRKWEIFIS